MRHGLICIFDFVRNYVSYIFLISKKFRCVPKKMCLFKKKFCPLFERLLFLTSPLL
ncbi:hypothetical protein KsCSTR_03650 [Candidatus Kuenenia stuttgartiensis]|uniref:Uncharacterized protein n=1 Tax=Kuenenia stuttgartiensis TaxID=174633 RepID=Q1PXW5_KUEST|nr:hypothetical protein KsCSTR_03650 [Candidatus Kuenenia stuttgartiensis]CAJ70751.1 unknown protein [Candidatus Kuenenia stuttgartiensis]CAJ72489.1 unknown protein [Candidatus Kuenenia stuttgartiensis]CAJ72869.1 unknown protein [Candidatus Kuenenia stuttgartiensis]CAJ72977.1 unknown protein [Candidatus Kuenenia stuttgartiensis]